MRVWRKNYLRLLIWLAVFVVAVVFVRIVQRAERDEMERLHPGLRDIRLAQQSGDPWAKKIASAQKNQTVQSNLVAPHHRQFIARYVDMTYEQKQSLTNLFQQTLRPAAEKWFAAYTNRVPFELKDITVDKFHSTLGSHMYTFMIGDTTLTFIASREEGKPAKVGYLMVRNAALDMNRIPSKGYVPDLSVPVNRAEIIQMVRVDTGYEFNAHEVRIRPTAASSAMNGGAYVDILSKGDDPNNAMNYKISMVFRSDGKLVNYERAPSF